MKIIVKNIARGRKYKSIKNVGNRYTRKLELAVRSLNLQRSS